MKFFIKDASGKLVEATADDILNLGTKLFNTDGTEYVRPDLTKSSTVPAPTVITTVEKDKDPIVQLTNLISDLTTTIKSQNAVKDNVAKMQEEIAAYKELTARGFVIPNSTIPTDSKTASDFGEGSLKRINMAIQGKALTDKRFYPKNQMSEQNRDSVAKYLCRVLKTASQGYEAIEAMKEIEAEYGVLPAATKTVIGDTGNTFPIPDIVESEVLAFARESSLALQYARQVSMTSDKQSFPAESSSATVSWGETTANSDPTAIEVELDSEVLSAYTIVKRTTLDDSPSDIVSWVFANMSEATGLELDNIMFNGDGTSTYANCSGILSSAAGYSVTLGSSSTAFSQISATDLSNMIGQVDGVKKIGARFFVNGSVMHYIRSLKDDNGALIFQANVGAAMPQTIWDFPWTEAVKITGTSASNTAFAVFGNLRYFLLGKRQGVSALQVDPYGLWTTNQIRLKIFSRWGGRIGLKNGFCRLLTNS